MEYLFGGVIENPVEPGTEPVFRPFWAHSRAEEGKAFVDFLEYVAKRRAQYPGMHIYHYAAYEKTALRNLSLTHVVGESAVDDLLRQGVLVDLYDTVRHSIRISENSYSIKKLEPLYMGQHLRSGDVTDAGASVVAYADYCMARDTGNPEEAAVILEASGTTTNTTAFRLWNCATGCLPVLRNVPSRQGGVRTKRPPSRYRTG